MKKRMVQSAAVILFLLLVWMSAGYFFKKHKDVKEFTAFFAVEGNEINDDNEIMELIAQKTGAKCKEIWLVGQTAEESIASYIVSGEYPDYISGNSNLYKAGALIPIDEYWNDYPNIRNYLSDEQWNRLRQDDGHIYWIPQFGVVKEETEDVIHEGEAFWIQTRVLKWAGYPQIRTLEQYFDLIEAYMEAHPEEDVIGFSVLCDDWKFFCLENPPQFLAGYPNDGSCIVDPQTQKVIDYNTIPEAKVYFQKLNEEFQKGVMDEESFTQTYEEYLLKLSSGRVLGMVDQWWNFAYNMDTVSTDFEKNGYHYVPLPVTMQETIPNQWHTKRGADINVSAGISITRSCTDIAGAMKFVNDLLEEDIMLLRYWGIEGVDYYVDEKGVFYKTKEQNELQNQFDYKASHLCNYSYFPRYEGKMQDGINQYLSEYQDTIFFDTLASDLQECFLAYGCRNYVEMIGSNDSPGEWFPMYTYTDTLTADCDAGVTHKTLDKVKREYLPRVIMAEDFETEWKEYMETYQACYPWLYYDALQKEVDRRGER